MKEKAKGCILADMMDRWFWTLEGSGEFTITSVRKMIDDFMLPEVSFKMRWIKAVPIKMVGYSLYGDLLLRRMDRLDLKYVFFGQKQAVIRRSVLCVVVACLEFS
nr:RNA-directed DNA polymerase, eukaryota [Tanacetum cinerariifolium]